MQNPTPATTVHGFYVVYKPVGPSSAGITNRLKWLLKKQCGQPKGVKIGHGGTLDPLADGILPIGVGKATKQLQALLEGPKTYTFTLQFGTQTTTDDAEGEATATSDVRPTEAQLTAVLPQFTGPILQTPPAFSALKINGERAYKLARAGEVVEMQPRPVTIHSLR
ncbi:MAG: tRNA pseudouridine(55) synthase TruB, partial [Hyphomicrobiales bacterium]